MSHIEFLGPPGAGKSTIFSELTNSDRFYGGTEQDAVRRIFLQKAGLKYRLPYRITPAAICNFFEDAFMEYRFGQTALEDFVRTHPDFIKTVAQAMESVSHEPERVFSLCRRSAERYQLGASTVSSEETLCLDESFAQRAFTILWREPDESFSLQQYFDAVPTPELVVYVDAPTQVCLERQKQRGRMTVAKDWETDELDIVQAKAQELCSKVSDYLDSETNVVTVENTDTLQKGVEQITSEISKP